MAKPSVEHGLKELSTFWSKKQAGKVTPGERPITASDLFRTAGEDGSSWSPAELFHREDLGWLEEHDLAAEVDGTQLTLGGEEFTGPMGAERTTGVIERGVPQVIDTPSSGRTRLLWLGVHPVFEAGLPDAVARGLHQAGGDLKKLTDTVDQGIDEPEKAEAWASELAEALRFNRQQHQMLIKAGKKPAKRTTEESWRLGNTTFGTFAARQVELGDEVNRIVAPAGTKTTKKRPVAADEILRVDLLPWRARSAAQLPAPTKSLIESGDIPPSTRAAACVVLGTLWEKMQGDDEDDYLIAARWEHTWFEAIRAVAIDEFDLKKKHLKALEDEYFDRLLIPSSNQGCKLSWNNLLLAPRLTREQAKKQAQKKLKKLGK